jgi:antitoxin YefM
VNNIKITAARANLFNLVKETVESHEPVTITSKDGDAVMLSLEDFEALQETLFVLQTMPGIRAEAEDVRDGNDDDLVGKDELKW